MHINNYVFPRYLFLFALTLVISVVGGLTSGDAVAQVRSAYTKNVDEPGRQPYNTVVEFAVSGCASNCTNFSGSTVVLLFDGEPSVPAGKRLVVQWVSATVPSNNSLNSLSFQTAPILSNQSALWQFHGPWYAISATANGYGMSSGAFFTVEPGESLHIRVKLGLPINLNTNISISGYLIDAVN